MGLDSLLLFLALLVVTALFVARPLLTGAQEVAKNDGKASHWVAERERVLEALTELDSDWQLGKVPEEIYETQRKRLLVKGAEALKELEKIGDTPIEKTSELTDKDLEKMIAARKAGRGKGSK